VVDWVMTDGERLTEDQKQEILERVDLGDCEKDIKDTARRAADAEACKEGEGLRG